MTGMAMAQDQAAPPASGHHNRMHAGFMGGPAMGMMFRHLDLSDDQKAQITRVVQSEKSTMQPLMQQERAAQRQMMQLITSGNFDQGKAAAIAAQESQLHAQLELEHAKMASHIYQEVLTADQQNRVTQMMAQHEERMQQKGGSAQPNQ
jgi:Spy/CpxP family protein refolding chaperone